MQKFNKQNNATVYNLYQDHAINLHITLSRIIQLQIINLKSATNITYILFDITPMFVLQCKM